MIATVTNNCETYHYRMSDADYLALSGVTFGVIALIALILFLYQKHLREL